MNKWIDINVMLPATDRKVLVYCPRWNSLGYEVAIYDGKKFTYYEEPNDDFSDCVEMWALFLEAD